jgi:hypothetical protein
MRAYTSTRKRKLVPTLQSFFFAFFSSSSLYSFDDKKHKTTERKRLSGRKKKKKLIATTMFDRKIVQTLISQSTICTASHFTPDDKIDRELIAEKVTD